MSFVKPKYLIPLLSFFTLLWGQSSWSGRPLDLGDEIQETQTLLDAQRQNTSSVSARDITVLTEYLDLLVKLSLGKVPSSCGLVFSEDHQSRKASIDSDPLDKTVALLRYTETKTKLPANISLESIYRLVQFIDGNEGNWRHTGRATFSLKTRTSPPQEVPVQIILQPSGLILLNFPVSLLGNGATKAFHEVLTYGGTWEEVARGSLRPELSQDGQALRRMSHEGEIYKLILRNCGASGTMPPGLPQLISVERDSIVQKLYHSNLEHELPNLSEGEKSKVLLQLAEGMTFLHDIGVVHSDIKPANILVDRPSAPSAREIQAVHTDFDLAWEPKKLYDARRAKPFRGTPTYAPLLDPPQWFGNNPGEAIENAKKGDVFSFGILAFETWNNGQRLAFIAHCEREANQSPPGTASEEMRRSFFNCLREGWNTYLQSQPSDQPLSLRDEFLNAAFRNIPWRMNSHQALEALRYIHARETETVGRERRDERSTEAQQSYARDIKRAMQDRSVAPGTYSIVRAGGTGKEVFNIFYKNEYGKVLRRRSGIPVNKPEELEEELHFLQSIGTIRTKFQFSNY